MKVEAIPPAHATTNANADNHHNSRGLARLGSLESSTEGGSSSNHHSTKTHHKTLRAKEDAHVVGMMTHIISGSIHENGDGVTIEQKELLVRSASPNAFVTSMFATWASLKVLFIYLVTIETYIALAGAVGMTCYWYFTYQNDDEWDGSGLSWTLLGFAVVLPMSNLVSMAFARRELALDAIAMFRSFSTQMYHAHALWDWDKGTGRGKSELDILGHCDDFLDEMIGCTEELVRFLTLPTSTQTRHQLTRMGRNEALRTIEVASELYESCASRRLVHLSQLAERIKAAGLSGSETSRLEQYHRAVQEQIERLRILKMYRTPQALRSFARIFTMILPGFYASTFASMAIEINSLGMGIAMALITTLALTSLYESIQVLEDSFVAFVVLDGVSVREKSSFFTRNSCSLQGRKFFRMRPPTPSQILGLYRRRRILVTSL